MAQQQQAKDNEKAGWVKARNARLAGFALQLQENSFHQLTNLKEVVASKGWTGMQPCASEQLVRQWEQQGVIAVLEDRTSSAC